YLRFPIIREHPAKNYTVVEWFVLMWAVLQSPHSSRSHFRVRTTAKLPLGYSSSIRHWWAPVDTGLFAPTTRLPRRLRLPIAADRHTYAPTTAPLPICWGAHVRLGRAHNPPGVIPWLGPDHSPLVHIPSPVPSGVGFASPDSRLSVPMVPLRIAVSIACG